MPNATLNAGVVYYADLWLPITDGMLIPPDSVIVIEPNWKNNSDVPVTGHVILSGKKPNAQPFDVLAVAHQDTTLQPGESTPVTFADIAVDQQEGIWPFNCFLTINDVDAGSVSFAMVVSTTITSKQFRVPLELQDSPYAFVLNPTEVYDHVGVYIYRILPLPIDVSLTFHADGLSYVEVLDADNSRWLLPEKTEIDGDQSFLIKWDGRGVFEPRVWKDGHVTGISMMFTIPDSQKIKPIAAAFDIAPYILGGGLAVGAGLFIAGRVNVR